MITNFKDFIINLITENLHPELQDVIHDTSYASRAAGIRSTTPMQTKLAKKIRELTNRGEETGIEGNMPKGSSRAYLKIGERVPVTVDGTPTTMATGMKVAIRSALDKFHKKQEYGDRSLGEMQNASENADSFVNAGYRVLEHKDNGNYETNHDGIFPPLVDHDWHTHTWSHVGHVSNVSPSQFKSLTKTPEYPQGISHRDFVDTLNRTHHMNNGRYWENTEEVEAKHNHLSNHPLVRKFTDFHNNMGTSPADYGQIKNMGIWTHPLTGEKHIVARDHGFGKEVEHAYVESRKEIYKNIQNRLM